MQSKHDMKGNAMTTDVLQEYFNSRGVSMRVDREAGVIRGVKVLGLESRNGRTYQPEARAQAAPLYENAKVNVNHPKGNPSGPRDYQDRIGVIRRVAVRPGEGVFGDFYFNPKHALAEQLIWDAEHAPENVGFSHNVEAQLGRRGDRVTVEAITRVQSVDLVADPATTRGLFENADQKTAESDAETSETPAKRLTREDLDRDYPELVESIRGELTEECRRLREEVERLSALDEKQQKRATVRRLLREFDLPDPELPRSWENALISEQFLDLVAAAPNEEAMRAALKERARMAWKLAGAGRNSAGSRPLSRDQDLVLAECFAGGKSFVNAIT
jgi:hypothetical protein